MEPLIFELSRTHRKSSHQMPESAWEEGSDAPLSQRFLRQQPAGLPEVSELDAVRHFTRLSQLNFSVDTQFYPLGSCTMKYNPRVCHTSAMQAGFLNRHPLSSDTSGQGMMACLYELQEMLGTLTGMAAVSLTPMAGAQGEFAGVAMIGAYHRARGDTQRTEILIPDAAHGTNPATAAQCGFTVREIPTDANGDVSIEILKTTVGPQTAGLMLTNPSTLGVFERRVAQIAQIVHEAGGLLYYDGANLNAIAARVRPGDMGFDAVHINIHKTFATPHGGGGPGAGPVGVTERLRPFLPLPIVTKKDQATYHWLTEADQPQSMGRLSTFQGNIGVLLRAYAYLRLTGTPGMRRVADYATLNANYLMARLTQAGFQTAFPQRRATHEFIITLKTEAQDFGVRALDFAKRLLDYGFYAPTIYFPMLVPECLLIEPTETESKETLDRFVDAMVAIRQEALHNPQRVRDAPHAIAIPGGGSGRLDDTLAARKPNLRWHEP